MIKKLATHGNSAALIIDKPILELLHITLETPLEVSTDGKSLKITPVSHRLSDDEFTVAHERVLKRHASTFKKLAEPPK